MKVSEVGASDPETYFFCDVDGPLEVRVKNSGRVVASQRGTDQWRLADFEMSIPLPPESLTAEQIGAFYERALAALSVKLLELEASKESVG